MFLGKIKIFLLVMTFLSHNITGAVDLVIFSFDRPMQLYALMESINLYMRGINKISVIYRTSNNNYQRAYQEVASTFYTATFIKQGKNPTADFKHLTIEAIFSSSSEYILFAVDDIIVTDYINLEECVKVMEKTGTYGFYLRMAPHLIQSYLPKDKQHVPPLTNETDTIFSWKFTEGQLDWAYPHTVDMTLYRKREIREPFHTMQYNAPNTLEAAWSANASHIMNRRGLCYEHTKIVNIPLNQVHTCGWSNPHMNHLSAEQLLRLFNDGKKIDIAPLFRIDNAGAHMDYKPRLINK